MTRSSLQLIPTARPLLPPASALWPLLQEIDARRWYANFGPLTQRFEAELALHFRAEPGSVVTTANATAGITLALREAVGPSTGLCLMPAWTFAATPIAACNAGLTPFFVDVDARSWQIDPARARALAHNMRGRIAAVVPVAPFGESVDLTAWAAFAEDTGIKVVVDAAAAFDTVSSHPDLVSVVSLHATKVLGVGDGGFILAGTAACGDRLRRLSNFGFDANRQSQLRGTNAKMSEYSAAVGLAGLSQWTAKRASFVEKAGMLRDRLKDVADLVPRSHPGIASATFNVVMRDQRADVFIQWLRACGLEGRKWWGEGGHRHPALAAFPRDDLSMTDDLAARVAALPFWVDMAEDDLDLIANCVARFPR